MASLSDPPARAALRWDYAPAPESRDAAALRERYDLFIGGEFVAPGDGQGVPSINPATEETLAEVAFAGPQDVGRAGTAGGAGQPPGGASPGRRARGRGPPGPGGGRPGGPAPPPWGPGNSLSRFARLIQGPAR